MCSGFLGCFGNLLACIRIVRQNGKDFARIFSIELVPEELHALLRRLLPWRLALCLDLDRRRTRANEIRRRDVVGWAILAVVENGIRITITIHWSCTTERL